MVMRCTVGGVGVVMRCNHRRSLTPRRAAPPHLTTSHFDQYQECGIVDLGGNRDISLS